MLYVPLTQGKIALIDEEDQDLLQVNWWYHAREGYAIREVAYKKIKMHRVILERIAGRPLVIRELTDHRDGNTLNNRRSNLRIATHAQNAWNAKKMNYGTNLYRGVSFHRGKWEVRLQYYKKTYYIGSYKTPEEAACAYNEAALQFYGEFARLNPVEA